MDVHKNARSCPLSRALLIQRVLKYGWSLQRAAGAAGLSSRRAREWVRRSECDEPLTDRSSRPHRTSSIPGDAQNQIIVLRRLRMTMRRIAVVVHVSISSVARVCRRAGLTRLSRIDPPPPPRRYERDCPGELLHVDVKRLGRFDRVGHRITRQRSFGSVFQGWEFVHVATDDASRVTYAEILPNEHGLTATVFLARAVIWFRKQNVPIERVMTDNGSAFVSHPFGALCRSLAIRHLRTRPYTPRTNGKVERMIQTLLREWAYRFTYNSSEERKSWLERYLHFYNFHRAHSALSYNAPISRLVRNNVLKLNS
jgi:transposase IS481 family protein/integrase-like protein